MEIDSIENCGDPCRVVMSGISLNDFKEIAKSAGASIRIEDVGSQELIFLAEKEIDPCFDDIKCTIGFWLDENRSVFWSR